MYESSFRVQKKLKFLFSELFSLFDIILSKSNEDKKKLLCLNKNLKIENYGNFKILSTLKMLNLLEYDSISIQKSNEFKTILFSSFHPEEFSIAIEIIKLFQCNKNIKFILAPRHLDKLNILIAKLIENKEYIRNDLNELLIIDFLIKKALSSNNIIIINKYGILSKIYSYSNLSIIGGSFNKKGGQNFIEALLQKSPVIIGPSYENFADLIEEFEGPWLHIIENFNNENELLNDLASKIKIILSNKEENIYDNLQTKIINIKKIAEKQNEYILNLMK